MAAASAALTASVLRLLIIYLWSVAGRLAPAAVCLNSPPSAESAENNSQRLQHDRPTGAGLSLPWLGLSLGWRRLGTSGAEDRWVSLGSDRLFSPVCPDSFHIP